MLALSFLQPWLGEILEHRKGFEFHGAFYAIENRTWKPHRNVIDRRIALHASAGIDPDAAPFINRLYAAQKVSHQVGSGKGHPRSAILGTAQLAGAARIRMIPDMAGGTRTLLERYCIAEMFVDRILASPWAFGPWVWLLADVQKLQEPVPAKGRLGLWLVPPDVAERVRGQEVSCR
jgi:hypothetical protein